MNSLCADNLSKFLFINVLLIIVVSGNGFGQSNPQLANYSAKTKVDANTNNLLIDADLTLEEALSGQNIPVSLKKNLVIVDVQYFGFDDKLHKGQLVVHKDVKKEIEEIFEIIKLTRFPVDKVVPACEYKWSDEESMNENNTCSFNYRFISGTRIMSTHANGLAIDINPRLNPYIKNGEVHPANAVYDPEVPGTLTAESLVVKEFKKRGWKWGGDWKSLKDYQHFEKNLNEGKDN